MLAALLGVVLFLAGANVSSGWITVLAAALLGALPWAWWTTARAVRTVTVDRSAPAVATARTPTTCAVLVDCDRSTTVVVADEATGLTGVGDLLRTTRAEVSGTVRLRRGVLEGGQVHVRVGDPLGLTTAWAAAPVATSVVVRPPAVGPRTTHDDVAGEGGDGATTGTSGQRGPELVGIREHRPGDPIAAVHWRASARRGELVSRESVAPAAPRRDVVVAPGAWDRPRLDRACELALALAEEATRDGRAVAIVADGVRHPWSPAVATALAGLPPALGVAPRPLAAGGEDGDAETVLLVPSGDGIRVALAGGPPLLVALAEEAR